MQDKEVRMEEQQNEKTTKEKIFDAALDLFSEKGFDEVSVRELTRNVGIRESSLYNHFKSKDEILDTIFERFKSDLERSSDSEANIDELISSSTPEEVLNTIAERLVEQIRQPQAQKILRIITIELYHNKKIRDFFSQELIDKREAAFETIFRKMIERGVIKPLDPKTLAKEYYTFTIYMYFRYFILEYNETDSGTSSLDIELIKRRIKFFSDLIKA